MGRRNTSTTTDRTDEMTCVHCGRRFAPGRRARGGPRKYCSTACRNAAGRAVHRRLEVAVLRLLEERRGESSVCPSEVARREFADDAWRHGMEDVRRAARRLAHRGIVVITQRGRTVDPATIRGPVRLSRGPRWAERWVKKKLYNTDDRR